MGIVSDASWSYEAGGDISQYTMSAGYNVSTGNRVLCFRFKTGPAGGSRLSWRYDNFTLAYANNSQLPLRWFVGTDPDSHKNAGKDTQEYTGDVSIYYDWNIHANSYMSGDAKVRLKPNTVYYLWLFPADAYQCVYVANSVAPHEDLALTPSGAYGGVRIQVDGKTVSAAVYIDTGTKIVSAVPMVDTGTKITTCV